MCVHRFQMTVKEFRKFHDCKRVCIGLDVSDNLEPRHSSKFEKSPGKREGFSKSVEFIKSTK